MKRLACLAIVAALAVPCAASDPGAGAGRQKPRSRALQRLSAIPPRPPAPLLGDDFLRTVFGSGDGLSRWALERAGIRLAHRFTGNVIGLQVPGAAVGIRELRVLGNVVV